MVNEDKEYWDHLADHRQQESKAFVLLDAIHKILVLHGSGNRSIATSEQKLEAIKIVLGCDDTDNCSYHPEACGCT